MKKGSLGAMRFITAVDSLSGGEMTEIVSRNLWKSIFTCNPGKDISDPQVWLEAGRLGSVEESLLKKAVDESQSNAIKGKVQSNSKELVKHGGFGLPSIIVDSPEASYLLFGSDRLELLAHLIGEKYQGPCPPS